MSLVSRKLLVFNCILFIDDKLVSQPRCQRSQRLSTYSRMFSSIEWESSNKQCNYICANKLVITCSHIRYIVKPYALKFLTFGIHIYIEVVTFVRWCCGHHVREVGSSGYSDFLLHEDHRNAYIGANEHDLYTLYNLFKL